MATSKEIRIQNLRALVREVGTADAVAQRASTAPMYLSQILNGVPSSTGNPRGVGDALARRIEAGCGKPMGWMDKEHDAVKATPAGDDSRLERTNGLESHMLAVFRDCDPDRQRLLIAYGEIMREQSVGRSSSSGD